MDWIHTTALASFLGLAALWDVRERRIPNPLVGTYAAVALGFAVAGGGTAGAARAAGGLAAGLGLLFVPFALGVVGAGDAKFLGAVGAFVGPQLVLLAFLYGTAIGALLALPAVWRVRHTLAVAGCFGRGGGAPGSGTAAASIPYAVPLALGTLAAVACERHGWSLL
jgi:prepilin peptidase CpaA